MRWIRLTWAIIKAKQRPAISVHDESVCSFRVWFTDIDVSIMNHAALLTVMEAGRIDLMIRSGFWKLARKNRWYFVSAAVNAQFFRPLKIFQKATLTTRLFHTEDPWIYIEQRVVRNGKEVATAVVKSKVKNGRESVHISDIVTALGEQSAPSEAKELIRLYEAVNHTSATRWITVQNESGGI